MRRRLSRQRIKPSKFCHTERPESTNLSSQFPHKTLLSAVQLFPTVLPQLSRSSVMIIIQFLAWVASCLVVYHSWPKFASYKQTHTTYEAYHEINISSDTKFVRVVKPRHMM